MLMKHRSYLQQQGLPVHNAGRTGGAAAASHATLHVLMQCRHADTHKLQPPGRYRCNAACAQPAGTAMGCCTQGALHMHADENELRKRFFAAMHTHLHHRTSLTPPARSPFDFFLASSAGWCVCILAALWKLF